MPDQGTNEKRYDINYWDGVNASVQHLLAKRTELYHTENFRSPIVGVLEKRAGQEKIGTDNYGGYFAVDANYGITHQQNNDQSSEGIYRLSQIVATTGTITISVWDDVSVIDTATITGTYSTLYVKALEYITVVEPTVYRRLDVSTVILDGTSTGSDLWTLRTNGQWEKLTDTDAQGIIGATADWVNVDGNLVVVNGRDYNRMIDQNGSTVTTSADAGSLFNSPRASKVAFYKSRIYLADFTRSGVRYPTTVLQSSYAMGIIALINGDDLLNDAGAAANGAWTLEVTSTKYFYTDSGMATYDIYRGPTKIATIVLTAINATSVTGTVTFEGAYTTFNSADEVWINGTFNGEKQYRWMGNPTNTGQNVKQYDTFKLSGGQQDPITLFETVGNILLIANKNTMMSWNDYTLQNFDLGIGCPSKNGATKVLGYLYFLHYSGIYSTSGGMPTLLSRKVEKYIKGATRDGIEKASTGHKGLSVFFSIGDVTLYNDDGSLWKVLPDVCLEYDLAQQNWYVHSNVPADYFTTFVDKTGAERLLMAHGGTGKHVKEFLSGFTDDGEEIVSRADTQLIQFSPKAEVYNSPMAVISEIDRGTLTKCFVSLDKDPYYEIQGTFEKGVSTLKVTNKTRNRESPVLCKRMRLSFRDASKQRNRILQASISYAETKMTQAR